MQYDQGAVTQLQQLQRPAQTWSSMKYLICCCFPSLMHCRIEIPETAPALQEECVISRDTAEDDGREQSEQAAYMDAWRLALKTYMFR